MSEKKENIKNGSNIEVDGGSVIVLNDVSVAEKSKTLKEEAPSIVKDDAITPDVKLTPDVAPVPSVEIPIPEPETEVPKVSADFIVPDINKEPSVDIQNPIPPVIPSIPQVPMGNLESPTINNFDNNNLIQSGNSYNEPNENIQTNNFYNQYSQNFNNIPKDENKIFKSTSDVEKLSEEVASEVRKALNEHVVYPMKATTDLLHELYTWGEEVANNRLNRKLLEEYDELKKKYTDLESVCDGSKKIDYDDNFNNDFSSLNKFNNFNNKDDDYNNFGGFGGFGRTA